MNIQELIKNKKEAIKLKKAQLKKCNVVDLPSIKTVTTKGAILKEDNEEEIFRTIVGNTYGFMDSHDDVHIKGIFTKSIKENGQNVLHLHDHVHQLDAKVGTPLKVYEEAVDWMDVGLDKIGKTTALLMDSRIEKARNPNIFADYKGSQITQHSVGMQYVKMELAVNDSDEEEEFAIWEKYKSEVINLDLAEEKGYFWAVTEAKLIEISCVIRGSNELTPTLEAQKSELENLDNVLGEENSLLLRKALAENKPLNLTLVENKPLESKSIFQIMAEAKN